MRSSSKKCVVTAIILMVLATAGLGIPVVLIQNHFADKPSTVDDLVEQLATGDVPQRRAAVQALNAMGSDAKPAVPRLIAMLQDEDPKFRIAAATALWIIEKQAEPLLLICWELWGKDHLDFFKARDERKPPEELNDALRVLMFSMLFEESSRLALAGCLRNKHVGIRRMAVLYIGMLPSHDKAIVPILVRGVDDDDWFVRFSVVALLGKMGPAANEGVPALKKALVTSRSREISGKLAVWAGAPHAPVCMPPMVFQVVMESGMREGIEKTLKQIE